MYSGSISLQAAPALSASKLRFTGRFATADHGLRFPGPTLRGAFGYALRRIACTTHLTDCRSCYLQQVCPYQAIFEGIPGGAAGLSVDYSHVPQPFVFDVASPGEWRGASDTLQWNMTLFGSSSRWAPYIIESFRQVAAGGIGPRRLPFELEQIEDDQGLIWSSGSQTLRLPEPEPLQPTAPPQDGPVTWEFLTPVSLRVQGRQRRFPTALELILAGRRRWQLLLQCYGQGPPPPEEERVEASDFQLVHHDLHYWQMDRFSGRQQRRIGLGGVLGRITLDGPWSRAGLWMRYVHQIHLGKSASFGFGQVRWRQEENDGE